MASQIPEDLKYTPEHEWAKIEGDIVSIGITDFAQSSLGDIVFVELPEVGSDVEQNGTFGVVESIKSVSDLYSPLSGEIVEVNEKLSDEPESCNTSPYDSWIIKVKADDVSQLDTLMDAQAYDQHCQDES